MENDSIPSIRWMIFIAFALIGIFIGIVGGCVITESSINESLTKGEYSIETNIRMLDGEVETNLKFKY